MSPATATFYMPAHRLADLAGNGIDDLHPSLDWDETRSGFSILDCFEHSLRLSRRMLLLVDDRLELLTAAGSVFSQPAQPDVRFVAALDDGPVKAALGDLSPLRALSAVTSGEARTGTLALSDDEGKIHARTAVRLMEPAKGNAIALLSPRGLRGYDQSLEYLIARIRSCDGTPLAVGNPYRMIDHTLVAYVVKPAVALGREETAFDAASNLIGAYLPVARANEAGIIADIDTEFLHDYRIALRKIRSVLSLFKGVYDAARTNELKTRFSALMAPSGPLRDLDVYLLEQESFYGLIPDTIHDGLDAMFALIRERRAAEHERLAAHLRTQRYDKEMKALAKLFNKRRKLAPGPNSSRSAHELARELIWKRYRRIRRIASDLDATTPDEEVHSLRIECKKLRYLMEFFAPLFPKQPFGEVLKPLKRLQDSLGVFNDHAVQQASLLAFVEGLGGEPYRLEIAQSVGALVTVLHQRQTAMRDRIVEAFARFNSERTRRTFRALFHDGKEI